jgi:hypothetical protein
VNSALYNLEGDFGFSPMCGFAPMVAPNIADYGAVRDFGRSDPDAGFKNGADAVLVQIPGTGIIYGRFASNKTADGDNPGTRSSRMAGWLGYPAGSNAGNFAPLPLARMELKTIPWSRGGLLPRAPRAWSRRRWDGPRRRSRSWQAAIGAGDHVLAPDDAGKPSDALGDRLGMLDEIGGMGDDTGDQRLAFRQLNPLPDAPFMLVARIGGLKGNRRRPAPRA